jgi:hypothetical protein
MFCVSNNQRPHRQRTDASSATSPEKCSKTSQHSQHNTRPNISPEPLDKHRSIERFHRVLLEKWAYVRDWHSDAERSDHYEHFVLFYNHQVAHGALGWSTPMSKLKDKVPGHPT